MMRSVKGTRKGNKLAVSIGFDDVIFCYFKSIAEQYDMSFGEAVNSFLSENVEIEKQMAEDGDVGFEYNLKQRRITTRA